MKIPIKKAALSITALVLAGVVIISGTLHHSGAIAGLNPQMDRLGTAVVQDAEMAATVEGQILDRNGSPITLPGKAGEAAQLVYDESFAPIIGYHSARYGLSGLRSQYAHLLFDGGSDHIGCSLTLTLETGLQEFCYGLIQGKEGSVTVLDPSTGEVLAMASSAGETAYKVNSIDRDYEAYSKIEGFFYHRATMAADPPGSTFKIVTALALLENGMGDLQYEDTGRYTINGVTMHNFGKRAFGRLDLAEALQHSSNAYFCQAGLKLGSHRLQSVAERFYIGKRLHLDFGTLYSNFESSNTPELLAQTAFGQGRTVLSPLHLAMMIGAIQNDGKLMEPYMVAYYSDDDYTARLSSADPLTRTVGDKKSIAVLQDMLGQCAAGYGLEGAVIAKSGTAELANGKNHAYMVMGAQIGERQYAICVSLRNIDNSSDTTKPICRELLNFLNTYGGI